MSFRKHGLKAIGLSVMMALGLLAFSASAAQATSKWLENGAAITTLLAATGSIDLLGVLEVPALSVEIDCTEFTVQEGDLLGTGAGEEEGVGHVKLLYENCKGYGTSPTLAEQATCKLFPTAADRTAGTNEKKLLATGTALVFLHTDGKAYIRIHGLGTEKIFTTIFSTGCVGIPNGTKVKGLVVLKVHNQVHPGLAADGETNRVKQLIEMADLILFPNELFYGANTAELLGSVWVKLLNNEPWGIC